MQNGDFAQGMAILQVFLLKFDEHKKHETLELERIHYRELTNFNYEYLFCKNLKPITFNEGKIWYFVFENQRASKIRWTLYYFDLNQSKEDPTRCVGEIRLNSRTREI